MTISLQIRELLELDAYRRTIKVINHACELSLRDAGSDADRERARYKRHWETLLYSEQIEAIRSRRLLRAAHRFNLAIDDAVQDSPLWRWSTQLNSWILTAKGHSDIQNAIRTERKRQRRAAIAWIGWAIGVFASFTGLLSVWRFARGL
ncbi:hypothetical protein [Mesorhizobium sp. ES1-1]|uniref:hypothetical protein n=1 Tax=Mesorhizobium sp. ES1-1 TaxID=2876629 RepID=UPI001CCFA145|nr:hypothetical protein [Mesorhizobium sp. ES1-1]MBZ9677703.1 hypothetical protein [Mesorhizobium sp. ES1-1]